MGPVATIAAIFELALADVRAAPGGQGRTFFAALDGRDVVVKFARSPDWGSHIATAVHICETLRGRGVPAPNTLVHGPVAGLGHAWIQQRIRGAATAGPLGGTVLDEVLDAIGRFEGVLDSDVSLGASWLEAAVWDDSAGWWQAAHLRDVRAARLCDELERWLGQTGSVARHNDYSHHDLNLSNVIIAGGHLAGVVDWDHAGVGDRALDIGTLACCHAAIGDTETVRRLVEVGLEITDDAGWRQVITYQVISRLGWRGENAHRVPLEQALETARIVLDASPGWRHG